VREESGGSQYIAVEGPIGVGKTSLARMLAEHFGGRAIMEAVEENPFLSRFYQDSDKYAFQTQVFFLLSRFRQQRELLQQDLFHRVTVTDYLFDKDRLFAHLTLGEDELALYKQIYSLLEARVLRPDLTIYLQASPEILIRRIRKRNMDYERGIDAEYIERVSEAYRQFFFQWNASPLLVVDTSRIDFVHREEDFQMLIREMTHATHGVHYFIPGGKL
jgi:deoxyadenosine/deoxycytidine kinase